MGKLRCFNFGILLILLIFLSGEVFALEPTEIISNSENWEDVYSSMLYASLLGIDGDFLTSTAHGPILLNAISKSKEVLIISSKDEPFVFNYEQQVLATGFKDAEEIRMDEANLELIDELDDITNFIVVSNNYGYNPIAVTPYAIKTDSWVFLADRANIAEIESILDRREIDNLIIYGYIDREIKNSLDKFDPEIIDNGNRFEDNIAIVEKYKQIDDAKQVLLSNGEFVEKEIMDGNHPVLFTGKDNVPEQIAKYLKESNIEVGVLIGNELINAATNIRRDTGISVMVKFAQSARGQTTGVSAVEGLDLFYLPTPTLSLDIYSIKYNKASKSIEITYQSKSNVPIYIKGTITAISDDDDQKVGDMEPVFIAPNDFKTLTYPNITLDGDTLKAEVLTLFGEVSDSLDRMLRGSFDMGVINIIDKCEVEINDIRYNKQAKSFYIKVEENSGNDCYVDVELRDVEINGIKQTIGTEGSVLLKGGRKMNIELNERMDDEDLDENPYVNAVAYFGQREDSLVGVFRGKFELKIDALTGTTWAIIVVVILLILLLLFVWKRKKDDDW